MDGTGEGVDGVVAADGVGAGTAGADVDSAAVGMDGSSTDVDSAGAVVTEGGAEATRAGAGLACTGVEMEALTAVSVGLLTVWDMLKSVAGTEMLIGDIKVTQKAGGRSGAWSRK